MNTHSIYRNEQAKTSRTYKEGIIELLDNNNPWDYFITLNFMTKGNGLTTDNLRYNNIHGIMKRWDVELNRKLIGSRWYYRNQLKNRFRFIAIPEIEKKRYKTRHRTRINDEAVLGINRMVLMENKTRFLHIHMKMKVPNKYKSKFIELSQETWNDIAPPTIKQDIVAIKDNNHDLATNRYCAEYLWKEEMEEYVIVQDWFPKNKPMMCR